MKSFLLAIATAITGAAATCTLVDGNYYCSETTKVIYENLGYSGSYKGVTAMDEDTGSCSQESVSFSGNLSPLDEELSIHFRGPLKLLQFGVYYQSSSSSSKREVKRDEDCDTTQHVHHKHVKRATEVVTATVVVDQYGNVVGGTTTSTTATTTPSTAAAVDTTSTTAVVDTTSTTSSSSSSTSSTSTAASSESSTAASAGDWVRAAYYTPGSTDNVTFLNYYGGSGSGVWSSSFGDSLSYANSDASGGSSSAVALEETTVASDVEYIIMSGLECGDDSETASCGFYRSGIPAYHGFDGKTKVFVFEFEMPTDSDASGNNADMPAIWMLNAKIPRTLQYGDSSCSCWATGCGELDLFEILSTGSEKLISHLHDGQGDAGTAYGGGGSQDYFARPTSGSYKAAVVFTGSDVHILKVDEDFDSVLSSDTVQAWIDQDGSTATLV